MNRNYWFVLLTYITMLFSGFVGAPLLFFITGLTESQAGLTWSILSFIIGLVIVLILLRSDMREDMQMERSTERTGFGMAIVWVIIGVFMAYVAQFIAGIIETNVFHVKPGSENTAAIMKIARQAPIFIIVPALVGPILEELVFRKIIFGAIYKKTNFFIAGTISALIFGIVHQEPTHILIYASMGFVFAFLYVKTKRIIVPIIVHMSLNSISVLVQFNLTPEQIEQINKQMDQLQLIFFGG